VFGGSLSEAHAEKIVKIMDLALKNGAPVVGLNDSGGARIQEGVVSLGGYADIFLRNTLASGVVPQISAILGPCAGGAVYSPAITDFIYMVQGSSYMFVTGPNVVKTVTHEDVTMEELGGAATHAAKSGVAHFAVKSEVECLHKIRHLFEFIPQNNAEDAAAQGHRRPVRPGDEELLDVVPRTRTSRTTCTTSSAAWWTTASSTRCTRLRGEHPLRLRARGRPLHRHRGQPAGGAGGGAGHRRVGEGGALRPLLRLVQHPHPHLRGRARLPPGRHAGARRHHPPRRQAPLRLLRGDGPKVTIITRKAYGGAYDVMSSKHIRGDINYAWPTAEIAVMGAKGAVEILYRREIGRREDPAAARTRGSRSTPSASPTRSPPPRAATLTT
jgi:propionyl-CoA carboxylase beta chain